MFNVSCRRNIVLLVLVAVLVTPWASAAISLPESPRTVQASEPVALDLFSRIWSFLRRVDSKAGCHIDPDGRCTDQKPTLQTKAGCHIDPSGRCIP